MGDLFEGVNLLRPLPELLNLFKSSFLFFSSPLKCFI